MAAVAIALDFRTMEAALDLVDELGDEADLYKVGLELFTRAGPPVVRELRNRGARVFLDLKLHDIPTTVARAVGAAVEHDIECLTVHAGGGEAMLRAAARAADGRTTLLAVTVLTSLTASELGSAWGRGPLSVEDEVLRLGTLAVDAGVEGLVASVAEAGMLRLRLGPEPVLVTPGIRLPGNPTHDQARVATPAEAIRAGSDVLVVGRAVTGADRRRDALRRIREAVRSAENETVDASVDAGETA